MPRMVFRDIKCVISSFAFCKQICKKDFRKDADGGIIPQDTVAVDIEMNYNDNGE